MSTRVISGLGSSTSTDVTVCSHYVGWWPCTMWENSSGTVQKQSITLAVASTVDTTNDYVTGTTAATWLIAGLKIKVRNTGTIPGGLSATTIYYAGKPDADKVSFHTTYADAIAGTNKVDITSVGTNNIVLYPGYVKDRSGNGNDLLVGLNINDTVIYAGVPYMSSSSSGSSDTCLGSLPVATFNNYFSYDGTKSMLLSWRFKVGSPTAGRSFAGQGNGASQGIRIGVDSSDTTKLKFQIVHSGGTFSAVTSGLSAIAATENHIALAIDGPKNRLTLWVNGEVDTAVNNYPIGYSGTVTASGDWKFGGATTTNAQAADWRDIHMLAITGSLPSDIQNIVYKLANEPYYRVSNTDWR